MTVHGGSLIHAHVHHEVCSSVLVRPPRVRRPGLTHLRFARFSHLPQIDDVLKALNGVRIDHNKGRCPRGFFLVPTDKTAWSWVKQVDCFSLYTKNVDLFFVCRLFFEELKKKTQAERNSLTPLSSQYDHELADPIQLQLPRVRVRRPSCARSLLAPVQIPHYLQVAAACGKCRSVNVYVCCSECCFPFLGRPHPPWKCSTMHGWLVFRWFIRMHACSVLRRMSCPLPVNFAHRQRFRRLSACNIPHRLIL